MDPGPRSSHDEAEPGSAAEGRWVHLRRLVGRYEDYGVVDVSDHDELHAILPSPPVSAFLEVTVTSLAQHPAAVSAQPDRPTVRGAAGRRGQGSRAT